MTTGTEKKADPMEIIVKLLEQNNALLREVAELRANGTSPAPKATKASRKPQPCIDTKTGKAYRTHSEAGMKVAPEYGLKVHNFVWYELVKGTKDNPAKCPNRFKDISQEEYDAIVAKAEAQKNTAPQTPQGKGK